MLRVALLLTLALELMGCSARQFSWSESAVLSDGSTVGVKRTIWLDYKDSMLKFVLDDPYKFALRATHPRTSEKIEWHGGRGIEPVQLEFDGRDTYLVVIATLCDV